MKGNKHTALTTNDLRRCAEIIDTAYRAAQLNDLGSRHAPTLMGKAINLHSISEMSAPQEFNLNIGGMGLCITISIKKG